jgi:hypothetical protein
MRGVSAPVPLQAGPFGPWSPAPDAPNVIVRGLMRRRDGEWSVTLYLTNAQTEPRARSPEGTRLSVGLSARTGSLRRR